MPNMCLIFSVFASIVPYVTKPFLRVKTLFSSTKYLYKKSYISNSYWIIWCSNALNYLVK